MLRRFHSLALRAVVAPLVVLLAVLVGLLVLGALDGRKTRTASAALALDLASQDLSLNEGRWVLDPDGAFLSLAARNPSAWVVGRGEGRALVHGAPPPEMQRLFGITVSAASSGEIIEGGLDDLLSETVIERRLIDGHSILLAVGGVDHATITPMDVLRTYSPMDALRLVLMLSVLGGVALLLALPLLRRAIRPIVQDATSIDPQDAGRRLDERRAPIELLPLARVFNEALDRLEIELGRRRRLISNVAHELRTPLAVLSLRIDTLTAPPEERQELRAQADRLIRLAEQMLDLERLSGRPASHGGFDLADVAQDVVASLAPMAMNAGYDLSLKAPKTPMIVTGDRAAVERAVTNLIGNAIAHGGGRGRIRVIVSQNRLEVSDEGPGVAEDVRARLFQPFARGATQTDGSGLGLHLTREIMRSAGGEAEWVEGAPRTTFRLQFPKAASPLTAASVQGPTPV